MLSKTELAGEGKDEERWRLSQPGFTLFFFLFRDQSSL